MSPKTDLSEFVGEKKGPTCTFPGALAYLDKAQREKVLEAMKAPEIRHVMIARRLSEWSGVRVSPSTVSRHRQGECLCG